MRLFVAIDFPEQGKMELWYLAQRLEYQADRARVVPMENYHLTLLFIGETNRINEARAAFHKVPLPEMPIEVKFDGIGSFKQQRDYAWWVGVKTSDALKTLAADLTAAFRAEGFTIQTRSFKPHITLARRVNSKRLIELSAPPIVLKADRISLMSSVNEKGRMVYTEIDCLP